MTLCKAEQTANFKQRKWPVSDMIPVWLLLCILASSVIPILTASTEGGHGKEDDVDTITVEQVKFFLDGGEQLVLVDLRPLKEFSKRRLPGARSIPLPELRKRFSEIPRAGRVILYCDCSSGDEAQAFFFLRDHGYRNVTMLERGFPRWVSQKYPLESGRP